LGRRYEGVKEVRLERGRQRGKRRRVNSIIVGFINLGCRPSLNPKISRGRAQYCSAPCNQNADYRPPRIPTVSLFSVNLSSEHAARSTQHEARQRRASSNAQLPNLMAQRERNSSHADLHATRALQGAFVVLKFPPPHSR
jgi:hypothetical protein